MSPGHCSNLSRLQHPTFSQFILTEALKIVPLICQGTRVLCGSQNVWPSPLRAGWGTEDESSEFELYLSSEFELYLSMPDFFPHWKQTHLLFWAVTEMTFMTYSKAGIIFRSRKTKTYCGSDKIKAATDKNIYKGRWWLSAKQEQGNSPTKHKEMKRSQAKCCDGLHMSIHPFLQKDSAKGETMERDVGYWV